jgi:small subunit ribosomal protein S6
MLMNHYETTVVLKPDVGGDTIEAALDRVRDVVTNQGGTLLEIDHWGKKRLAYEIQKHTRGIYVHTQFLGKGPLVAELERNLRINHNILRFLTIKTKAGVNPAEAEVKEYVKPEYGAEETSEAPAAEAAPAQEAAPAAEAEAPAAEAAAPAAEAEAPAAEAEAPAAEAKPEEA